MFEGGALNLTELNASIPLLELDLACEQCDGKLGLEVIGQRLREPAVRASLQRGVTRLLDWIGRPDSGVLTLINDGLAKAVRLCVCARAW